MGQRLQPLLNTAIHARQMMRGEMHVEGQRPPSGSCSTHRQAHWRHISAMTGTKLMEDLEGGQERRRGRLLSPASARALLYGAMNVVSASGIVGASQSHAQPSSCVHACLVQPNASSQNFCSAGCWPLTLCSSWCATGVCQ